jgi:ABC-type molybdenum transport system ATPase subunit/photorepair protein PhrA
MPIISVRDLLVQRSGNVILQGINWEVQANEHWVVLGANGSGKTSLLSCITGYLTPSRGQICVLQRFSSGLTTIAAMGEVALRVGRADGRDRLTPGLV